MAKYDVAKIVKGVCLCGCGSEINAVDAWGQHHRFANRHQTRGKTNPAYRHGMAGTPIYGIWNSMVQRCTNPAVERWADYGGRGIMVCDRWRRFENFFADMGPPPDGMTIERIDNHGNYEPGNCKWIPRVEQARNRRSSVSLTFNGETMIMSQWAKRFGISRKLLHKRLKSGWPMGMALTEPSHPGKSYEYR